MQNLSVTAVYFLTDDILIIVQMQYAHSVACASCFCILRFLNIEALLLQSLMNSCP